MKCKKEFNPTLGVNYLEDFIERWDNRVDAKEPYGDLVDEYMDYIEKWGLENISADELLLDVIVHRQL